MRAARVASIAHHNHFVQTRSCYKLSQHRQQPSQSPSTSSSFVQTSLRAAQLSTTRSRTAISSSGNHNQATVFLQQRGIKNRVSRVVIQEKDYHYRMPDGSRLFNVQRKLRIMNRHIQVASSLPLAQQKFEQLESLGLPADTFTFTALMRKSLEHKQPAIAVKYFDELRSRGLNPDQHAFSQLILAHSEAGNFNQSLQVWNEVESQYERPHINSWMNLISVYAKNGRVDEAVQIWRRLNDGTKYRHTADTYGMIMRLLAENGKPEQAFRLINEMKQAKLKPPRQAFEALIKAFAQAKRPDVLDSLKLRMKQMKVPLFTSTWEALVEGYGQCGRLFEVRQTFDEFEKSNCRVTPGAFETLIKAYIACGDYSLVQSAIDAMQRTYKLSPLPTTLEAVLEHHSKSGDKKALNDFYQMHSNLKIEPTERSKELAADKKKTQQKQDGKQQQQQKQDGKQQKQDGKQQKQDGAQQPKPDDKK